MGKVIKILFSVVSSVILCLIILPLAVALLLSVHTVQNFVVQRLTKALDRKMGVELAVDKISVRGYNKLTIEGLYLEDLKGDTMLYIPRMSANLSKAGIFKGDLMFGGVKIDSAKIYFNRPLGERPNISQLVAHVKAANNKEREEKERKSGIMFTDVDIEHTVFRYFDERYEKVHDGINFRNMDFSDVSIAARQLNVIGDSVMMELRGLSFIDATGYGIDLLASDVFAFRKGSMYFRNLQIASTGSEINMPYLDLLTGSWKGYRSFADSVQLVSKVSNSRLEAQTLNCFVKSMKPGMDFNVKELSLDVQGGVRNFEGIIYGATINDNIFLSAEGAARAVTDDRAREIRVNNVDIRSDMTSAELLFLGLSGRDINIDRKLRRRLDGMGDMRLTGGGHLKGHGGEASFNLVGDLGYVAVDGVLADGNGGPDSLRAGINMNELHAGKLTGAGVLGPLTMTAEMTGVIGKGRLAARVESNVESFRFDGRTYSNIVLNADYNNKDLSLDLVSFDPAARLALSGAADFAEKGTPRYDFKLNLQRIGLHRLNVRPDSVAWLSGTIDGTGIGGRLDELNGRVRMNDMLYVSGADSVNMGAVNVTAVSGSDFKSVTLDSELVELDYFSEVGYKESLQTIKQTLFEYLPVLAEEGYEPIVSKGSAVAHSDEQAEADPDLELTLRTKDTERFLSLALNNINVAEGTELRLRPNDDEGRLLSMHAPYIDYKQMFADDLHVELTERGDSLDVAIGTRDFLISNFRMPQLSVEGVVCRNDFELSAGFDDNGNDTKARFCLDGRVLREDNGVNVDFGILPSFIDIDNRLWNIGAKNMAYNRSRIMVDSLVLNNDSHAIMADGVLSAEESDTLSVRLHDVRLDMFEPLIGKYGYGVGGSINGYADVMGLGNGIRLNAEAMLDSVRVNDFEVAPLKFESQWNTGQQRVIFTLKNMNSKQTLVRSYHRFYDKAFLTDITVEGLPVAVLTPLFKGGLEDVGGSADLNMELRKDGAEKRLVMNGEVKIDSLRTHVAFTGVDYEAGQLDVGFKNSVATVTDAILTDAAGNQARLNARLDLKNMQDVKYDLKLIPDNLMVLDVGVSAGQSYYGRVSLSGGVDVKGSRQGTTVEGAVTTGPNSLLNVAVGGASDFYIADYVTFESPRDTIRVDSLEHAFGRQREYKERVRNENRRGGLDVNMNLTVTPDLTFKLLIDPEYNNVLTANGSATLDVNIRPRDDVFNLYGMYEITSGNYNFNIQNIIDKNFTLSSGSSITWMGKPADATLDITASYRLRTSIASLVGTMGRAGNTTANVDCMVNITDKLTSPQFSFDVQLPDADSEYQAIISSNFSTQEMMATQFFYLLAFGTLYSDTNYAENLNIGASTGTSLGFDFLTSQIRNLLSADDMNFNLRYTPKSTVNSDEYGFYFQNDLINDKLVLELEGNYDTGNNPMSSTNRVSGGGTLTYYIDSSGNLVLKGYSRTIDRFDENQGLQDNGVGIYFKEDFDNMTDLIDRLKRRFSRKNKQQKTK